MARQFETGILDVWKDPLGGYSFLWLCDDLIVHLNCKKRPTIAVVNGRIRFKNGDKFLRERTSPTDYNFRVEQYRNTWFAHTKMQNRVARKNSLLGRLLKSVKKNFGFTEEQLPKTRPNELFNDEDYIYFFNYDDSYPFGYTKNGSPYFCKLEGNTLVTVIGDGDDNYMTSYVKEDGEMRNNYVDLRDTILYFASLKKRIAELKKILKEINLDITFCKDTLAHVQGWSTISG